MDSLPSEWWGIFIQCYLMGDIHLVLPLGSQKPKLNKDTDYLSSRTELRWGPSRSQDAPLGGSYYVEKEEGESDGRSNLSFSHTGTRCPFTLMTTLVAG